MLFSGSGDETMIIKEIFGESRVVGLAGEKNSGKTNNLMAMIKDFRETNKVTPIVVYGLNEGVLKWLNSNFKNIIEVSSINQMSKKTGCLIIIDEFQLLHINDRRYKDQLDKLIDFIYHNNNWIIFSSPNLREFNSVIGSKIERWCLKTMRCADLINGSHLKDKVMAYSGRFKSINDIIIDKDKILVMDDDSEKVVTVNYIKEIDNKLANKSIFEIVEEKDMKMSKEKSKGTVILC